MRHVVECDFHLGQTVYFRLDAETPGMVTAIHIAGNGAYYTVTWAEHNESSHFAFELTEGPVHSQAGVDP